MIDVKHCAGCEDDFYNGNNDLGVVRCWHLEAATLAPRLLIGINQPPPYLRDKPQMLPVCYRKRRFVTVKPEAIDSQGLWKS